MKEINIEPFEICYLTMNDYGNYSRIGSLISVSPLNFFQKIFQPNNWIILLFKTNLVAYSTFRIVQISMVICDAISWDPASRSRKLSILLCGTIFKDRLCVLSWRYNTKLGLVLYLHDNNISNIISPWFYP